MVGPSRLVTLRKDAGLDPTRGVIPDRGSCGVRTGWYNSMVPFGVVLTGLTSVRGNPKYTPQYDVRRMACASRALNYLASLSGSPASGGFPG